MNEVKKELKAINSHQKSFYKRAYTHTDGNATILTSYKTQVCKIVDGKFIRLWGGWSSTTAKHVNEFRQQNGLPKITKAEWLKMDCDGKTEQYKIFYDNGFVSGSFSTIFESYAEAEKELAKHYNKKTMFVYWVEEV
jgi:hypothetical protein